MSKTGQQIEDDVFAIVKASTLASTVNGVVYKFGTRPRDSQKEDIVVKFVEGLPGDVQSGTVAVMTYVPNIDPYANGVFVRNISRLKTIEIAANTWVNSLSTATSNYRFRLSNTIQSFEEPNINQHFVSFKLKFELKN